MLHIYVDGDACSVKDEVYRVAERYDLPVTVVANARMFVPQGVRLVVVKGQLDAADDWIAAEADEGDIVVTADIPLAARCIELGAGVLSPRGRMFTEDNIGELVATRDLNAELREMGGLIGGPPPFQKKDRSRFLQKLDETIQRLKRGS